MTQREEQKKAPNACPFCDQEILDDPAPYCRPCQVELRRCGGCHAVVERKATVCHRCGQPLGER